MIQFKMKPSTKKYGDKEKQNPKVSVQIAERLLLIKSGSCIAEGEFGKYRQILMQTKKTETFHLMTHKKAGKINKG